MQALNSRPSLKEVIKINILFEYLMKIRTKLQYARKVILQQFVSREDHPYVKLINEKTEFNCHNNSTSEIK